MSDEVRFAVAGDGPLPPARCPRCGEIIAPRAVECSVCGAALPELVVVNDGDASKWVGWEDEAPEVAEAVVEAVVEPAPAAESDGVFSADELIKDDEPAVAAPVRRRVASDDFDERPRRGMPWKAVVAGVVVFGLAFAAFGPNRNAPNDANVTGTGGLDSPLPPETVPDAKPETKPTEKAHKNDATPAASGASGNAAGGVETLGGAVLTLPDAALTGDVDGMKKLLAAGADANEPDKKGWTPLMNAAAGGKDDAARLLLENKADANAVSPDGDNALILASRSGAAVCIRLLAGAGADLNAPSGKGDTPLLVAVALGHTEAVQALLEKGADPNKARPDNGFTPLMAAASGGHADTVKALLSAKADVNAAQKNGDTALKMATAAGHDDVAQLLKDAGAK